MTRLLLLLVRAYQRFVSPWTGECCRFEPSCSRYCALCLKYHGPYKGTWLTLLRLLRCNPFFSGGVDLPPLPAHAEQHEREPDWERIARACEARTGHGGRDAVSPLLDRAPRRVSRPAKEGLSP
jgi:uncharacterized protein